MTSENYQPNFRDRIDRMRCLREQGHSDECATAQTYSNTQCQCLVSSQPLYNADPNCKHKIVELWSGVKCKYCPGWFCY